MGNRPSSVFGFGVVLGSDPTENSEPGSPWQLCNYGGDCDGVVVEPCGSCHDPSFLFLVAESVGNSDDWMPEAILPKQIEFKPEWIERIEKYVDRWGLRGKLAKGFEKPGFIHAPFYG